MKEYLPLLFITVVLTGCESVYLSSLKKVPVHPINVKQGGTASKTPAGKTGQSNSHLASNHWSDVSKIRDETTHPSYQVSQGKMTKVQAAQYLGRFRIQLIDRNSVDGSMYEVYLRSAVDSQRSETSTPQSRLYIQSVLHGWQQHWKNMINRPSNPAFTSFSMEVMSIASLQ